MDSTLAIASQAEAVCHVTTTILTEIKSMLSLMRVLRVAIWHHHLGQRHSPENWPFRALVIECDVVENNAFAVVETNVNLPVDPLHDVSIDLERNAFRLCDIDGLEICAETAFCFDSSGVVVVWGGLVDGSPYWWNINVNDLMSICVEDWAEVEWIRVLAVVDVGAVVHESLLQSDGAAKSLIITDCPSCIHN